MSKTKTHCEPTINEVKSLFKAWRQTRKRRERIPEALWHQVLKLADRYSISVITTNLGINSKQLKEAQLRHSQNKTIQECARLFMETNSLSGFVYKNIMGGNAKQCG